MRAYVIENHPQDSRVRISHDGIFQALPAKMGTGGGNTPLVLIECFVPIRYAEYDKSLPTLRASGADAGGGQRGTDCL